MTGVIVKGTIAAVFTYVIIGVFGYLMFAAYTMPSPYTILK
jgi:uncharacterized membrane protein